MTAPDNDAFNHFLAQHKRALQRISRHTQGEVSLEEVHAEAWLMVHALAGKGRAIDLAETEDQQRLISHLYQQLVRYTELQVRHAVRLDHAPGDDDQPHPLMNLLTAGESDDPLVALLQAEEARERQYIEPTVHESLAGAYLHLLRRFDNRMNAVASHLLISVSYCYRRCAQARDLAVFQQPLPRGALAASDDEAPTPGPWRRFRMVRTPVQLCFDFEEGVGLFAEAAR